MEKIIPPRLFSFKFNGKELWGYIDEFESKPEDDEKKTSTYKTKDAKIKT